jgi:hypothetical protein
MLKKLLKVMEQYKWKMSKENRVTACYILLRQSIEIN